MKLIIKLFLVFSFISLINSCDLASTDPTIPGLKGYLYYAEYDNQNIRRYNFGTEVSEVLIQNARYPEVTPNGEIVHIDYSPYQICKTDFTNSSKKSILSLSPSPYTPEYKEYAESPRLSYNQKYIAYSGSDNSSISKIYVIDANTGDLVASIGEQQLHQAYYGPNWAPDGSIYVTGWQNVLRGIYKISNDFKTVTLIDSTFDIYYDVSLSPDGKQLTFVSDGAIWTMNSDGTNPKLVHNGTINFSLPNWSPDGKYIVAISVEEDGYAYVFDLSNNSFMPLKKLGRTDFRNQLTWVY